VVVKVPAGFMEKAGTYHFVLRAKDAHGHLEKAHREKWALERNQTRHQFPAANFSDDYRRQGGEFPAQIATDNQRTLWHRRFADEPLVRDGSYVNWKWWDPQQSAWQQESQAQTSALTLERMERAFGSLKRVAVWSVNQESRPAGFGLYFGREGQAENTGRAILADHSRDEERHSPNPENPMRKYYGSDQARLWYFSDLPEGALSDLVCAFIFCCHPDGSTTSPLVDALAGKGAQFAGTVVGGKVDGQDAVAVYKVFWARASGNPLPVDESQEESQELRSLAESLQEAVNFRQGQFAGQVGRGGQGDPSLVFRAYWQGGGSLVPGRGGKTEEELQGMGGLP
jgi:hypothetical protein